MKIRTKLIFMYTLVIFVMFFLIASLSLLILNKQYKKEIIRSDKEVMHQISNSIVLMTDLMVEKNINLYSNSEIQSFFVNYSEMGKDEFNQKKATSYTTAKNIREIRQILIDNAMLYTQIDGGVTLVTEAGAILASWPASYSLDYYSGINDETESWDEYFDSSVSKYKWEIITGRNAMSFIDDPNENILMCIYKYTSATTGERRGYICISIGADELEECYEAWDDPSMDNTMMLLSMDKNQLTGLNAEKEINLSEEMAKRIRESLQDSSDEITLEDNGYIYNCVLISERNWILVDKIPLSYITTSNHSSFIRFFIIFVIGGLFTCVGVIFVTNRFSNRIAAINELMQKASANHYSVPYTSNSKDELDEIGNSFNVMQNEIKSYASQLIIEEKKRTQYETNYLHAQINTHFLYNVLNSVKVLSILKRNEDINIVITSLVKLLKGTLDVSDEMLTIQEELQNVTNYYQIENIVHLNEISLEIHCEEYLMTKMVPKLLIQPLVENCILHGFSTVTIPEKKIEITISEISGKQLCIKVKDNGCGVHTHSILNNPKSGKHIGIQNIKDRILLLFGSDYGLEIESTVGKGTTIIMHIPLIESSTS